MTYVLLLALLVAVVWFLVRKQKSKRVTATFAPSIQLGSGQVAADLMNTPEAKRGCLVDGSTFVLSLPSDGEILVFAIDFRQMLGTMLSFNAGKLSGVQGFEVRRVGRECWGFRWLDVDGATLKPGEEWGPTKPAVTCPLEQVYQQFLSER